MSDSPIEGALPCARCAYDLVGLRSADVCPECGFAIERSLEGNALRNSDPRYVQTLARGAFIAECAPIINFMLFLGSLFVAAFYPIAWIWAIASFTVLLSVVSLVGWWMLSTPDPALGSHNPGQTARKVLRSMLVLTIVAGASIPVVGQIRGGFPAINLLASSALVTVWIVKLCASTAYLGALERRLRNPELAERVQSTRTWLVWSIGLILALALTMVGASCIAMLSLLVLIIDLFVLMIAYIGMLDAARTALNLASIQARTARADSGLDGDAPDDGPGSLPEQASQ